MPQATCRQEVLTLHGFVNYLSKFLPRLSDVVQPLRDLATKDAKFTWAKQHDKAFKKVKKLVINHPILAYYDCKEEVIIQCDFSEKGLGATILPKGSLKHKHRKHLHLLRDDMHKSKRNVSRSYLPARDLAGTYIEERRLLQNLIISHCKQYLRSQYLPLPTDFSGMYSDCNATT